MTLRAKTLLIVTMSLVAFLLAILLLFRFTVFNTFRRLELDVSTFQVESIRNRMDSETELLHARARLWCVQQEMSRAAQENGHPTNTFTMDTGELTLTEQRLHAIALITPQGDVSYAEGLFRDGGGVHDQLKSAFKDRLTSAPERGVSTLDATTALLLAIHPVRDTNASVTAWLILGRALQDSHTTDGMVEQNFALTLTPGAAFTNASGAAETSAPAIAPSGYDTITAHIQTRDLLSGEDLVMLLDMPRLAYARGLIHSVVMSVSLVSLGLFFVIMTIWMLNRHVLSRLTASIHHLRSGLHALTLQADIGRSLDPPANDEFGALAKAINTLLATLRDEQQTSRHHQRQLEKAEKLASLGTLVSGVAHEINTPNNYISLNAEMLERRLTLLLPLLDAHVEALGDVKIGHQSYAEARSALLQMIRSIREGGDAIKRIVADLKVASRQDPSEVPQPVDIHAVLQSSLRMLEAEIDAATEHLSVDLNDSTPMVMGNAHRLEQVFTNLIQNACQALEDRSQSIRVGTRSLTALHQVEITITDQGAGIPADILDRIQEPFFTTRRNEHGTGLGLYVTAAIVERHKGQIAFESEVGSGTQVTVLLPAATGVVSKTAHEDNHATSQ